MLVRIDPTGTEPLGEQIAGQIRGGVAAGAIAPGERLPSARDLAAALDVNMHTVLRAYGTLRDEGLLELRRGRGAVVSASADASLVAVHTLARELVTAGRRFGLTVDEIAELVRGVNA